MTELIANPDGGLSFRGVHIDSEERAEKIAEAFIAAKEQAKGASHYPLKLELKKLLAAQIREAVEEALQKVHFYCTPGDAWKKAKAEAYEDAAKILNDAADGEQAPETERIVLRHYARQIRAKKS